MKNIYLRKDGRWEGRLSKGMNNLGKRTYNYFFGHTRQAVEIKMMNHLKKKLHLQLRL